MGVAVGILILAAALFPVINEATTTEHTFTNDGLWRMKSIENGDSWSYSSSTWTYNDEVQTVQSAGAGGYNALLGDEWCVRLSGQARGPTISGNASSLTAEAGEITITFTGIQGTLTQDLPGYGLYTSGDYILTAPAKAVYVKGDTQIYATGNSNVESTPCNIHIAGTINDGVTITVMENRNSATLSNIEVTNVSINYEVVSGYVNLYKLNSITADVSFDATSGGETTSKSGSITYNSYIVPYQVTAELAVHASQDEIELLETIPVLITVGLIMGIVGVIAARRFE